MRMGLAWMKSQKTLDNQKDYIEIRPEAPGVRAKELDPNVAIIAIADSGKCRCVNLKAPSGGVKCPGQVAPTTGS